MLGVVSAGVGEDVRFDRTVDCSGVFVSFVAKFEGQLQATLRASMSECMSSEFVLLAAEDLAYTIKQSPCQALVLAQAAQWFEQTRELLTKGATGVEAEGAEGCCWLLR